MTRHENGFERFTQARSVPALLLAAVLGGCGAGSEGVEPSDVASEPGTRTQALASCTPLCNGACTPVQLAQGSGLDRAVLPFGQSVYYAGAINYEANYSYFGQATSQANSGVLLAQRLWYPPTFLTNGTSAYALFRNPSNSQFSHFNEIMPDGRIVSVPGFNTSRSTSIPAVDATKLYALDLSDESVWSQPLTGGAWTQATRSIANVAGRSVHVDDTHLYIVADNVAKGLSIIWKAPKQNGATPTAFVSLPGSIVSLTSDATDLYFADRTGGLYKASKSSGAVTKLASTATNLSITVDAERYYWFNGSALTATCKSGGGSQVLTTVSSSALTRTPEILSVDANGVYWRGSGAVWRIAK